MADRLTMPIMLAANAPPRPAPLAASAQATLAVVDEFVVPAYRRLADAAKRNEAGWEAFARERERSNFAMLRAGYNLVADAWAMAQIVKMGPASLFLRYERFAYWPEARNATGRALDALLASRDAKDLTPETLATNSVAGQGLTALERILYDGDDPAALLRAPGAAGARRVQVGLAISRNLSLIAADLLRDWTTPNGVRAAIAAGRGWNNLFANGTEASSLLLTDLVGAFRLMHDVKLLPVLGDSVDTARPRMAEAWRSNRAQRDLSLNLEASRSMAIAFARRLRPERKARMEADFAAAERAVTAVPADLGGAAANPAQRPRVVAAQAAIRKVQLEVADVLPTALGITLGFNALDGD